MTITIYNDTESIFSANLPEGTRIGEAMEAISALLQASGYTLASVIDAYQCEAERLREVVRLCTEEGGEQ